MTRLAVALLSIAAVASGCGSGTASNEYELIQDPVFDMDISPPVGWTYFPPATTAGTAANFFLGQSNDTVTAKKRADTEITAAMIEALAEAQIPTYNVQVMDSYGPDQIANLGTTNTAGEIIGVEEGGAITQTGPFVSGMTVYTTYSKPVQVTVRNAIATRYTWNVVKNNFLEKLAVNDNVRFVGDITVNTY